MEKLKRVYWWTTVAIRNTGDNLEDIKKFICYAKYKEENGKLYIYDNNKEEFIEFSVNKIAYLDLQDNLNIVSQETFDKLGLSEIVVDGMNSGKAFVAAKNCNTQEIYGCHYDGSEKSIKELTENFDLEIGSNNTLLVPPKLATDKTKIYVGDFVIKEQGFIVVLNKEEYFKYYVPVAENKEE